VYTASLSKQVYCGPDSKPSSRAKPNETMPGCILNSLHSSQCSFGYGSRPGNNSRKAIPKSQINSWNQPLMHHRFCHCLEKNSNLVRWCFESFQICITTCTRSLWGLVGVCWFDGFEQPFDEQQGWRWLLDRLFPPCSLRNLAPVNSTALLRNIHSLHNISLTLTSTRLHQCFLCTFRSLLAAPGPLATAWLAARC
jgi:hypothetical protein